MPPQIRSSDVFLKSDIANILDSHQRLAPQYAAVYDSLRVAFGIEPQPQYADVTVYARRVEASRR